MAKEIDYRVIRPTCVKAKCDCYANDPGCYHSKWEVECPECGATARSRNKLGPYKCKKCKHEFMGMVACWYDAGGRNG